MKRVVGWGAVAGTTALVVGLALASRFEPLRARAAGRAGAERDTVVLLHGLARSSGSMEPLAERLAGEGYRVENVDYPSTRMSIEELVAFLDAHLAECCPRRPGERLHFVTHSLGGVLTRAYLLDHRPPGLGRVVMLAPPNQGSEWVDELGEFAAFDLALGPAADQLGTDPDSVPSRLNRLGPVDYELGVIAGTDSVNPLSGLVIPGDSDGTVSVESTRVDGMVDFLTLDANHTFIMKDPEVMDQVVAFLETGRFAREHDADAPAAPPDSVDEAPPGHPGGDPQ